MVNSFRMLIEMGAFFGLIQVALLQSESSSLEYAVNADRVFRLRFALIGLVWHARLHNMSYERCVTEFPWQGWRVDQCCSADGKKLRPPVRLRLAALSAKQNVSHWHV